MQQYRIHSPHNQHIKHLTRLIRDRRYRYDSGQYVVEGFRALEGTRHANALFVSAGTAVPAIPADELYRVEEKIFERVVPTENSQGVLAVLPLRVRDAHAVSAAARYVLLDGLQDPGNMGTIIRTAAAFGVDGVIVTAGSVDPFSPKAARAAAGALEKLDIIIIEGTETLRGRTIIAADARGKDVEDIPWPGNFILAVGSEGHGVSDEIRSLASLKVALPMRGGMESLNAAVAAGIILYRAMRGTST